MGGFGSRRDPVRFWGLRCLLPRAFWFVNIETIKRPSFVWRRWDGMMGLIPICWIADGDDPVPFWGLFDVFSVVLLAVRFYIERVFFRNALGNTKPWKIPESFLLRFVLCVIFVTGMAFIWFFFLTTIKREMFFSGSLFPSASFCFWQIFGGSVGMELLVASWCVPPQKIIWLL